jgi:putative cell wall-binding protein
MLYKSFLTFLAFLILLFMGVYFLVDSSYEKSIEAKYYYSTGNYKKAYDLSSDAFKQNSYNKMASTIMTQSQVAIKYDEYIKTARKYISEVAKMGTSDISTQDRAKIKMISQIMIDSHKKLVPTKLTDKVLVQEAYEYYEKFLDLYESTIKK